MRALSPFFSLCPANLTRPPLTLFRPSKTRPKLQFPISPRARPLPERLCKVVRADDVQLGRRVRSVGGCGKGRRGGGYYRGYLYGVATHGQGDALHVVEFHQGGGGGGGECSKTRRTSWGSRTASLPQGLNSPFPRMPRPTSTHRTLRSHGSCTTRDIAPWCAARAAPFTVFEVAVVRVFWVPRCWMLGG